MLFEKVENRKNGKLIIKLENIEFIREQYALGLSQKEIARLMGVSDKTITQLMKQYNIKARDNRDQALKYKVDETYFEKIDSEEKAYWLGFLYADGFIQNRTENSNYKVGITLTEEDKGHLEKFKKSLKYEGNIKIYNPSKCLYNTKPYCKIIISSPKLALDLIDKGCLLKKTNIIKFPSKKVLPEYLYKHFIRGLIDGDGSIVVLFSRRRKPNCAIHLTGTKELLSEVLRILGKENLKLYRKPTTDKNVYSFTIGGNIQTLKILNWLYEESTIYLERKFQKYIQIKTLN